MTKIILFFLIFNLNNAYAEPSIQLVKIYKSEHKLQLISEKRILHEFQIALGHDSNGHKKKEGDGKTPEGTYMLDYKKFKSGFYRAIHISYPNNTDIDNAKLRNTNPGGDIMIHGQKNGLGWLSLISQQFDWTRGCIALSNDDMGILFSLVSEGTTIKIFP